MYEPSDERLPRGTVAGGEPDTPGDGRHGRFERLPGTANEAARIARIAAGNSVTIYDGFTASRANVAGAALRPYRILHFATHGVLDSRQPERSGLVFSLFDQQGRPTDGYLRLLDVYDLSLSADLVVLSACETARGREMSGEGIIGLTRGFLLAGAAQVVSTQWQVADKLATPQLIEWFYDALLRQNMSPAAALRYAQRRMWRSPRWSAPYFWAAFTLHGG